MVFRILSLLGIKGGSRDGRDGERGKRWTGISQQYIPGRTIAFVQSRLRELLGKCWIWAQGRLGPVCTGEVSRWPRAQVGGPGMLILEKDWGGVLVHSLPTSTQSSDCFSFWSPLQHSWWGMEESTDLLPPWGRARLAVGVYWDSNCPVWGPWS